MIEVKAGQSLRAVIANAPASETVISVEAGSACNETIELPSRDRSVPLVIQSSRINELPPDKRVGPSDAAKMFKIIPPQTELAIRAIQTQPGARFYSLLGAEVTHDPTRDTRTLISLGDPAQRTLEEIPHSLLLDRCYVHGHQDRASIRGIALNSAKTDILNTYISDIHSADSDSQAICGWAGPGPYNLVNNYYEAAGENVMWGGGDPLIAGLVPSDIQMLRSTFFKPLTWKVGHSSYAGRDWSIKNLFETKNVRRILVDGCVFDGCWPDSQVGFALVLKSNNQDSTAPWSVTEDLTISNSIVRNCEHGVNILGVEYPPKVSEITKRLKILNVFWDINKIWLQIVRGGEDILLEHNTFMRREGNLINFSELPVKGLALRNNLGIRTEYGIKGDASSEGIATLNLWAPGWSAERNVLVGADPNSYPANNFYPKTLDEVGFVDRANGNYRLSSSSAYKGKGTDGKDPGCDFDALLAAQQGAEVQPLPTQPTPIPAPVPAPTPTPTEPTKTASPDGTKAVTITDTSGAVWTIGPNKEALRDGKHAAGGLGTLYKLYSTVVYLFGLDSKWWKWIGTSWMKFGDEPGVASLPKRVVKNAPADNSSLLLLIAEMEAQGYELKASPGDRLVFQLR